MFTGLIEAQGHLITIDERPNGRTLTVQAPADLVGTLDLGASIALNGVCTTVVNRTADTFRVDIGPETLACTQFAQYTVGQAFNLERPLLANSRLGGHLVSGHVDGCLRLKRKEAEGIAWRLFFELPTLPDHALQLVPKGSIALDGVSLTVNSVNDDNQTFDVCIIPHTWEVTTLGKLNVGEAIHYETDMIAKYVCRLQQPFLSRFS
ncbi:MAG: riboflavin synthase [Vampirovibrionales bacterium]